MVIAVVGLPIWCNGQNIPHGTVGHSSILFGHEVACALDGRAAANNANSSDWKKHYMASKRVCKSPPVHLRTNRAKAERQVQGEFL